MKTTVIIFRFVGLIVFAAAVKTNLIWLAFVGVLNSIIGLYYYLVVLKVVYLYRSEHEDQVICVPRPYKIALSVLSFAILVIGAFFAPWFTWSTTAAAVLF